jgi:hypothetical protein
MLLVTEGEREKRCEEGLPSSVIFLDEKLPRHASGQGYVRVVEQSVRWKEMEAYKVFTYQGLMTCTDVDTSWTMMSSAITT